MEEEEKKGRDYVGKFSSISIYSWLEFISDDSWIYGED